MIDFYYSVLLYCIWTPVHFPYHSYFRDLLLLAIIIVASCFFNVVKIKRSELELHSISAVGCCIHIHRM